jgi:hypothetical protein
MLTDKKRDATLIANWMEGIGLASSRKGYAVGPPALWAWRGGHVGKGVPGVAASHGENHDDNHDDEDEHERELSDALSRLPLPHAISQLSVLAAPQG